VSKSTLKALPTPPAMNDATTAGELWEWHDTLEAEAASLLGHMLFGFSRLDVNLGLCLVWVDDGSKLQRLTKTVSDKGFKARLDDLADHVAAKWPPGSTKRLAWDAWIAQTDAMRVQRNQLVHGRWGVEAHRSKVVNIVGLPTGDNQVCTEYSLEELAAVNEELRALLTELGRLRFQWPV